MEFFIVLQYVDLWQEPFLTSIHIKHTGTLPFVSWIATGQLTIPSNLIKLHLAPLFQLDVLE